jgi:type II restriction enzyme
LCETKKLLELGLPEPKHGKLPDIIAYSASKQRLYIIEAVYSSGSISDKRLFELKDLTKNCTLEIIYVTAFLDTKTFQRFASIIAWETEVWIASAPAHMIHFNGDKFLEL